MAHYAFLDANSVVTEVITGIDETELLEGLDPEIWYSNFRGQVCKRTSYNTYRDYAYTLDDSDPPQVISVEYLGSKHRTGGTPFRGQYAAIGDIYDPATDTFVSP
jgi:hypothetical protein